MSFGVFLSLVTLQKCFVHTHSMEMKGSCCPGQWWGHQAGNVLLLTEKNGENTVEQTDLVFIWFWKKLQQHSRTSESCSSLSKPTQAHLFVSVWLENIQQQFSTIPEKHIWEVLWSSSGALEELRSPGKTKELRRGRGALEGLKSSGGTEEHWKGLRSSGGGEELWKDWGALEEVRNSGRTEELWRRWGALEGLRSSGGGEELWWWELLN